MRLIFFLFCIVSFILMGCKDSDDSQLSNSSIRFNMYANHFENDLKNGILVLFLEHLVKSRV